MTSPCRSLIDTRSDCRDKSFTLFTTENEIRLKDSKVRCPDVLCLFLLIFMHLNSHGKYEKIYKNSQNFKGANSGHGINKISLKRLQNVEELIRNREQKKGMDGPNSMYDIGRLQTFKLTSDCHFDFHSSRAQRKQANLSDILAKI